MSDPRPTAQGVLELHPKGYGFLRNPARHYLPTPSDAYVGTALIDKFRLAEGVRLFGPLEPPRRGQNGPRLATVELIEGQDPKQYRRRNWDELTPSTRRSGSDSKPVPNRSPRGSWTCSPPSARASGG
jgi:transcription termination factor Rho